MSVPAKCTACGHRFTSKAFMAFSGVNISYSGCTETCPKCGGRAELQSGTYDFVGSTIAAFTAPGVTRAKVEAARDLAAKVAQEEITAKDAAEEAEKITAGLGNVFMAAHDRGITFDRILALILAVLAFWGQFGPDADLQALLAESQKQNELSQRMLEEFQKQNSSRGGPTPTVATPPASRLQTTITKNRHERRKEAKLARRDMKADPEK